MPHMRTLPALLAVLLLASCAPRTAPPDAEAPPAERIEGWSLLGRPLVRPDLPRAVLAVRIEEYADALRAFEADPESEEAAIWLGRRTAYLGRYNEAVRIYSEALAKHPDSYRLLRHRGHRWITLRQFDRAVADLSRAARLAADHPDEIEPDGQPNARNIPTSTVKSNIEYHLGLAHYLRGEFTAARDAWQRCLPHCRTNDMFVATSYWLWLALQRLGEGDSAAHYLSAFNAGTEVIENTAYLRLILLFKGEIAPQSGDPLAPPGADLSSVDAMTYAYGLGAWHLVSGRRDRAMEIFNDMMSAEDAWPAFGSIAAEAELARNRQRR